MSSTSLPRQKVWPTKAPGDVLAYGRDFGPMLLAGESITAAVWTVPAGLTNAGEDKTGTTVSITLGGGQAGETYPVKVVATINGGPRVIERTTLLPVAVL